MSLSMFFEKKFITWDSVERSVGLKKIVTNQAMQLKAADIPKSLRRSQSRLEGYVGLSEKSVIQILKICQKLLDDS